LIIFAIIGVIGTVIAATISVMGNYNVEKIRQETELTRIASVFTPTQSVPTVQNTQSLAPSSVPPTLITQPGPVSINLSLPANAGWVDTNVYVQAGQLLKITAEGKANTAGGEPNSNANPNGFQWQGVNCDKDYVEKAVGENFTIDCLMTGAPWGALVGHIDNGTPFLVGDFMQVKVTDSGNLFLAFNDCCTLSDNTGAYLVTIQLP
jgi:hypothetical protein